MTGSAAESVRSLSDSELLEGATSCYGEERLWAARVVAHLVEIERRNLHAKAAYSSLFDFCRRGLGMSDGVAWRRVNAANLVKRFPVILDRLQKGEMHMSGLELLGKHLQEENHAELLEACARKSVRQMREVLAARFPRPDVPDRIAAVPSAEVRSRDVMEPLSQERYRIELTAGKELCTKLERARALMRHRHPTGEIAPILDKALDLLIAQLEKQRLGATARSTKKKDGDAKPTRPGYVPRAVRREVYARDGDQCTYRSADGRRCEERGFIELDHDESRALGGSDDAHNVRLLCRTHNQLHAENVFGRETIKRKIAKCRTGRKVTKGRVGDACVSMSGTGGDEPLEPG